MTMKITMMAKAIKYLLISMYSKQTKVLALKSIRAISF